MTETPSKRDAELERLLLMRVAVAVDDYLRLRDDEGWDPLFADLAGLILAQLGDARLSLYRSEIEREDRD